LAKLSASSKFIINFGGLVNHTENIVRTHIPVSFKGTASGRSAGSNISEDQVEGTEDSIDQVNFGGRKWGKETRSQIELGAKKNTKKGSKKLGNNDGSKNS